MNIVRAMRKIATVTAVERNLGLGHIIFFRLGGGGGNVCPILLVGTTGRRL
jgi:hypothetical protein